MKTVLLVDHAPFFGGSESFLVDLVGALDRTGYTPIVVSDTRSPVLDRLRASGAPLLTLRLPRINRSPAFAWHLITAGTRLAALARRAGADIIHTFTARTHLVGAIASLLSGIPLVWRIGDDTLPPWLFRTFRRIPRRVVGVSEWLVAQYPGVHFDGLVPDGARAPLVITRDAARRELGLPPSARVVAHVGRIVRWKGQHVFIRALAKVMHAAPEVHGMIVGSWHASDDFPGELGGGEPYFRELVTLATELGVNTPDHQRLHFAGFVRDPGLAYAAADVFTHTSTLPEPFGRTIIEAMMAGCAVIAADAGGPAEIIERGRSGLLTPPGDADALGAALVELLAHDDRRISLAAAGRERAMREYTLEIMARRMVAAYDGAMGSG